ncbi:hypothetical protein [Streptomyces sp. NPDC091371]|uniref:hypothetical protein n=1 Tax=Streptomyces sp. NPDC091371 TaxID=3155303 RepID=UPI003430ED05
MGESDSTEPASQETDNVQHADWVGPTAAPVDPETDSDPDAETAAPTETDWMGPG